MTFKIALINYVVLYFAFDAVLKIVLNVNSDVVSDLDWDVSRVARQNYRQLFTLKNVC